MDTLIVTDSGATLPPLLKDAKAVVAVEEVELLSEGSEQEGEDESTQERTFHSTDAAYVLPNDTTEHHRLELQSRLLYNLLGGKVFHAPLVQDQIRKTLDIGCGTGAVTHHMAVSFPEAQVIGADLSPVPSVREKLPNIAYVQGNIMDLDDGRFEEGSFDLIFSRLLVLGMENWEAYIARCVALAKPGGWIEMHDLSNSIQHIPTHFSSFVHLRPHTITAAELATSTHPTNTYHHPTPWLWQTTLARLLAARNADLYIGDRLPSLFAAAGLQDVEVTRYMLPFSRWEELTQEEREVADYLEGFVRDVIPVAIRKAGDNVHEGVVSGEEVESAVDDVGRYVEGYEGGRTFLWLYVVRGRKVGGA